MKNFSISKKLIIGFLIGACITGVIGAVGLINITILRDSEKLLYNENMLGVVYSGDANTYYQRLRYNMTEMIILKDEAQKNDYIEKFNKFVEVIDTKPQGL